MAMWRPDPRVWWFALAITVVLLAVAWPK